MHPGLIINDSLLHVIPKNTMFVVIIFIIRVITVNQCWQFAGMRSCNFASKLLL